MHTYWDAYSWSELHCIPLYCLHVAKWVGLHTHADTYLRIELHTGDWASYMLLIVCSCQLYLLAGKLGWVRCMRNGEQCLPILHCMSAVCGSGSIDVYTMYLLLLGAPTLCFTRCIASAWNEVQLQSMPCMHVSLSFPSRKNITFSGSHKQSTQA